MYQKGDKIMIGVLCAYMIMSLGLASWYDTWTVSLLIGLPAVTVPFVLSYLAPGARVTRIAAGIGFMVMSALTIHQAHGMVELHFGIFALLAFLLYYRDWLPIVIAAAVIAVHHIAFNFFQEWNYGVFIFENRTGIHIVLIHAAYVVFEVAVLVYMAIQLHREAIQTEEVQEFAQHMSVSTEEIDLTFRQAHVRSNIGHGLNHFMEAVHNAINKTRAAAAQLSSTSVGLTNITNEANQGAQIQRSETDQVATAMNEMTATVQEVARSADEAAKAAVNADDVAENGHKIVIQTVEAITRLAHKVENAGSVIQTLESETDKIGSVLDVIKSIAEQTNLLALNAAIEAARAGEQGRGFAVVADEVRTLASRTQQSTAEIQEMIQRLQQGAKNAVQVMNDGRGEAKASVDHAAKAGEALTSIVSAIGIIRDMNTQIASAAEEQGAVAEEINRNILTINQSAENSATAMDRAAETSGHLNQLAGQLEKLVGQFKV
ncbi:MAG: methyl-accepting chemotaxis protein [Gammaproteobacteria bacterium]|nr:methyl-accepting chemotaxis protein [Gammaproteobacteria bacterium]